MQCTIRGGELQYSEGVGKQHGKFQRLALDYPDPPANHLSCSCRTHSPKGRLLGLALLAVIGTSGQSGDVLGLCIRPLAS
ncbi:hypothetical protein [Burkholderia vietnamiensis]|uniref:hypothetical protein n=1 Tax=Burkholderia vietnamiensis TaxID=60552 RepID=UPI0012D9EF9A|nr:hypothetical protein [Burkholderia vietnamiensis]